MLGGAGAALRLGALQIGPELSLTAATDEAPAIVQGRLGGEALVGARYALGPLTFGAGGGPGIGRLPGTPAFRLFASVGFARAGAALLALAVGFLAAGRVTRPILELVAQARLIGQRRWRDLSLPTTPRRDEIGELTGSLGRMAGALEQGEAEIARQAKLHGDLGRFMDRSLVEAIVLGEQNLTGRKAVTQVYALEQD